MASKARPLTDSEIAPLREALLRWYHTNRRRLPWRETPSLYGTVVSEFMLQQTQVKTVLPYFERWLRELPDFKTLAAADEARVLHLWEGLGYYSRARNLQKLARELIALREIPREREPWMELPGIGPYSSAAITSIAFGTPAACVDGNVVRILARWTGDATAFKDSSSAAKHFTLLADRVLNPKAPGDHNQAMMELGATLCTRHNPQCLLCPVAEFCEARRLDQAEDFPKLASKVIETREVTRVWSMTEEGLLLHRGEANSRRLAAMHELPTAEQLGLDAATVAALPLLARHVRGITRYRITEFVREAAPERVPPPDAPSSIHKESLGARAPRELIRIPLARLPEVTLSGPHRRWINVLLKAKHLQ